MEPLFVSVALWLVHQPGGSDRPAADWAAFLLPAEGLLTLHAARCTEEQTNNQNKPPLFFSFSGGAGVHQRHQPQADVLAVSGLA